MSRVRLAKNAEVRLRPADAAIRQVNCLTRGRSLAAILTRSVREFTFIFCMTCPRFSADLPVPQTGDHQLP
jgi:hypothetical protein